MGALIDQHRVTIDQNRHVIGFSQRRKIQCEYLKRDDRSNQMTIERTSLTSDDPAMVNFNKARSFEGIFVVERDRTSPKEAILVS